MKAIYHGHSCVEVKMQSDGKDFTAFIDPFITGNPLSDIEAKDVKCDYIILTHGHADHFGDTIDLAKNNDATVIATAEIADYLESKGVKAHAMNLGGAYYFPFGKIKLTLAHHSSSLPDGTYAGDPAGILLINDNKALYHAGDTALFHDMKLIGEVNKIDYAFLPIGDNFTMGIDDAVKACQFTNSATVTPIHYNTFDVIKVDDEEFKRKIEAVGKKCNIMEAGDEVEI